MGVLVRLADAIFDKTSQSTHAVYLCHSDWLMSPVSRAVLADADASSNKTSNTRCLSVCAALTGKLSICVVQVLAGASLDEVWASALTVMSKAYSKGKERATAAVSAAGKAAAAAVAATAAAQDGSSPASSSSSSSHRRLRRTAGALSGSGGSKLTVADAMCCTVSGPGLDAESAEQLWQQNLAPDGPGKQLKASRVKLWAWLYHNSSSSSSSNSPVGRRRRRTGQTTAAALPGSSSSNSSSSQWRCTLVLSLQPVQLPERHMQFGQLVQHIRSNVPADFFGPANQQMQE
jgi:hypothetical protein